MAVGTWILERCDSTRFPYRLQVFDAQDRPVLILRAQDRWPAANRNIFCLRDNPKTGDHEAWEEIERIPILALQKRGKRVSLVLDRARYKRCDFLFLLRDYKKRPGESYEQIYWQTQTSMSQRRPKVLPPALHDKNQIPIAIDSGERYPWRFPGSRVERRRLACGDYALTDGEGIQAVVERKTFDNLLADFGVMPLLNQRMLELASYEYNALVIEAPYEDFINPGKLHHYSPSFCAAAIADLYASHPRLRIVFCSNRKTANRWTQSFFAAVWQKLPSGEAKAPQEAAKQERP